MRSIVYDLTCLVGFVFALLLASTASAASTIPACFLGCFNTVYTYDCANQVTYYAYECHCQACPGGTLCTYANSSLTCVLTKKPLIWRIYQNGRPVCTGCDVPALVQGAAVDGDYDIGDVSTYVQCAAIA